MRRIAGTSTAPISGGGGGGGEGEDGGGLGGGGGLGDGGGGLGDGEAGGGVRGGRDDAGGAQSGPTQSLLFDPTLSVALVPSVTTAGVHAALSRVTIEASSETCTCCA